MGASTTVTRTVSFRDEPDALLDYLVARTAETVGRRVERSNVVVLARVAQAVDGGTVRLAVERLLAGALPDGDVLVEAPATPAATAPPDPGPTLVPGGRAVFFLTRADRAQPVFRPAGGRYGVVDDDEALVEQTAAAAEWYAKLPHEPDPRAPALRAAIVDAIGRVPRPPQQEDDPEEREDERGEHEGDLSFDGQLIKERGGHLLFPCPRV